ncbi:unnamed protein product [Trichobilharzia regenti]|nr:unnamed protein product [Trichobilharzia regenti]
MASGNEHVKNGNTPLHLACINDRSNVVLSLCNAGAPLEVRNKDRKTPLLCAVFTGSESCVHALLRSGARADVTDEGGNTPLHIAAIQGDYPTVRLLSKAYTDVDIFNSAEFTPLHLAARHGHLRTVRYLILAGADPGITSRTGITPDVMAFAQGYAKVGMLLTKMKPEKRTAWIEQLKEGTHRFPRIKVKIFGSSLVGKTQLTHSLLSGPISAYLKKKLTSVSEFAGLSGELGKNKLYRLSSYFFDFTAFLNVDSRLKHLRMQLIIFSFDSFVIKYSVTTEDKGQSTDRLFRKSTHIYRLSSTLL